MWIAVVFELNNLDNASSFNLLQTAALTGKISKEDFVRECILLEIGSVEDAVELLDQHVDRQVLKQSTMYRKYLSFVTQKSTKGKIINTGAKHRKYYESMFEQLSNPK
ncbi:MAG TPA: hypothetical protein DDW52_20750 [Planctomycetaceae bacterium]|nr:hypothetical protein [Planctomycetaceae bacterium]